MKIGILTFHCAHNYGAVLQAYGLQEYLRSQGHETYIIDYRPGYLTRNYKAFNIRFWMASTPREIVYKLRYEPFLWKHRILRSKAFDRFIRNRFDLHPYVRHTNFSDFDAIFLGSDQIWNKTITGQRYDEVFFGGNATCRVIAYAASMGRGTLSDKDRERLRQYLAPMTAIGVREEGVVAAAERQTGLHNDRPHASGRRRNVRKDRLAPGLRSEIRPRIRLEPLQTRGA